MAGRNLLVFCDGTSNEVEDDVSNVLKLYRIAAKDKGQVAFYHPGVGTIGLQRSWGRLRQGFNMVLGLASGWGMDDNILEAYRFLANHYQGEDDKIFLFGFSRGAYAARALAGMIHMIGLLRPEQLNLAGYALTAYKRASSENRLQIAWQFRRVTDGRRVPIHFLGVWDTVASVLVPRRDRLYLPSMEFLPYTKSNPSVRIARHACAIDEKRRMFRLYYWAVGQSFQPDPFDEDSAVAQDQVQMWFAGDHSDVGGGYPEKESAPAKLPLIWLAKEAECHGMRLKNAMFRHLALGKPLPGGRLSYVAPDATAPIHESMRGSWHLLEWLPKKRKWRDRPAMAGKKGYYVPRSEPRFIPPDADIHPSVAERMAADPRYRPANLPASALPSDPVE